MASQGQTLLAAGIVAPPPPPPPPAPPTLGRPRSHRDMPSIPYCARRRRRWTDAAGGARGRARGLHARVRDRVHRGCCARRTRCSGDDGRGRRRARLGILPLEKADLGRGRGLLHLYPKPRNVPVQRIPMHPQIPRRQRHIPLPRLQRRHHLLRRQSAMQHVVFCDLFRDHR